jgi:asparagine synthase (glutamine-hydrolysing)
MVGSPAGGAEVPRIHRMLDAMRFRGGGIRDVRSVEGAALATIRHEWEQAPDFSGPVGVLEEGGLTVAADASLYYRADLRATTLPRGRPAGDTASHLIVAAYRAFGSAGVAHLEGDFAFALHDRQRNTLIAARDFLGTRPLFYALLDQTLLVASSVGALRAHPFCPSEWNLQALADTSSMLLAASHETALVAIRSLPAGHLLRYDLRAHRLDVERFWFPPRFRTGGRPEMEFEEAAVHLRGLLQSAVAERMPRGERVAISLSGGWDSPILYGVAHAVAQKRGQPRDSVRPASISFPPGDSGREDEMIARIASHYGQAPKWLRIEEMPLLYPEMLAEAAERDEPFAHPYSPTNRGLASAAASAGARVEFNGYGGDTLFHGELSYLGDLLARGRIGEFVREWRSEGLQGAGMLYRSALLPRAGPRARRLVRRLTGSSAPPMHLHRPAAPWIRQPYRSRSAERERLHAPSREWLEPVESFEHRWMLEHPLYPRLIGAIAGISLARGVEERMPLIDRRVLEFATTRPRPERRSGSTTKRLLRAAAADLLPPEVLAPRTGRTGTMSDYWSRSMARDLPRLFRGFLRDPLLAQLGVVDPEILRRAVDTLRPDRTRVFDAALYTTFQTELWLRAQAQRSS